MIKLLSNLIGRAVTVKTETTDLANTALRVGSLLEDLSRASVQDYDNTVAYQAQQYVIHQGVLAQAVTDTVAGESPITATAKWSKKLVIDPAQVNESNTLPIAASAVATLINDIVTDGGSAPNATELVRGLVRQATDAEFEAGLSNDTYTTPRQVKALFQLLINHFSFPALVGQAADADIDALCARLTARNCGGGTTPPSDTTPLNLTAGRHLISQPATGATPASEWRIVNPGGGTGLTMSESGTLQTALQQRWSDNSWRLDLQARTIALISPTPGASVSTGGLVNVPGGSISSNATMGIRYTITSNGVAIDGIITVIDQPDSGFSESHTGIVTAQYEETSSADIATYAIIGPASAPAGATQLYYLQRTQNGVATQLAYPEARMWVYDQQAGVGFTLGGSLVIDSGAQTGYTLRVAFTLQDGSQFFSNVLITPAS